MSITQILGQRLIKQTTTAKGFVKDDPFGQLGTHLLLPPWSEKRRGKIEVMLKLIRVA